MFKIIYKALVGKYYLTFSDFLNYFSHLFETPPVHLERCTWLLYYDLMLLSIFNTNRTIILIIFFFILFIYLPLCIEEGLWRLDIRSSRRREEVSVIRMLLSKGEVEKRKNGKNTWTTYFCFPILVTLTFLQASFQLWLM